MEDGTTEAALVLVARNSAFSLPTACPSSLPVYLYLRLANASFHLQHDSSNPDADFIPYVEYGDYVAFNNERSGVIECLKENGIIDLDSKIATHTVPDWVATKAMVSSWLADAVMYELWVDSDGSVAKQVYFSDLSWPIAKILHWKQIRDAKQALRITNANLEERESEIYRSATVAYEALSTKLGDQHFFFENRPTSLDAIFLGHALFVLQAFSDTSRLRSKLLLHNNLVRYAENLKMELLDAGSASSIPRSPHDPSTSSTPRRGPFSRWGSKPKTKPKKEKTEEEKTFKRRAKYFLATQLIAVLVFVSLLGGSDSGDAELDDDNDDFGYES